jgi:hypothetical protein
LLDVVEVVLEYFGHDLFGFKYFKKLGGEATISAFHSRSVAPSKTTFFEFELTPNRVDMPKLVSPLTMFMF